MSRMLSCSESDLENDSNYILIRGMLLEYAKQGENKDWTTYRATLTKKPAYDHILASWVLILQECLRNGFMAPYVANNRIIWRQVRTSGAHHSLDLCTLCERQCDVREAIETGRDKWNRQNHRNHTEKKKCW
jgi:hypothetical protein